MASLENSLQQQMKHLLSTDEHSDVHFLVGDEHEKEVLPAHKHILKNASDVFEAMFRFDSQNGKSENVSVNCPAVVEIPDIDAAAFKVMLSFIYTGDLSLLNGDNAMAVLYAVQYPGLGRRIFANSHLRIAQYFLGIAKALLFELEDFSLKCLRYICQNAAQLFGSDDFLQIDQKMLCNLLDRDRLLLNNEFEIWKAAILWADEKCCQNGIECSSENRRSLLGPALFKIRFPNIHEENFANYVVPSGVLTMEEVLGVYQFNYHPFLYLHGIPGLYSLKFPSHGRIFNWNKAKDNRRGTLALEIEKVSEFAEESVGSRRLSDAVEINGLTFQIGAQIREMRKPYLGSYLWYDAKKGKPSNCVFSATLRIVSEKSEAENSTGTLIDHVFDNGNCISLASLAALIGSTNGFYERKEDILKNQLNCWVFGNFISLAEFMEPSNGFYNSEEDKMTLTIDVILKDEQTEKFVSIPNKSNGTLSMEIEKVSEFAREIIWSERKSETVHLKGFPWRIMAEVRNKIGSTDKNEKWLGISLLCDAPKKAMGGGPWNRVLSTISQFLSGNLGDAIGTFYSNWHCCVHSATFRIVSQKNVADNSIGTRCNRVLDNESKNSIGFGNFISFAKLMDPSNGFYNKEADKVTLTIDLTVKEAKMERFILDESKSNGTISMEIEKLSEFAREIIGSERKSETVHIKRFSWKIWAQIGKKDESSNNNEKWLDIYLLCGAPKEGFYNFISFTELMDPSKGLYDKKEDKVTLAIDVTVKEPKMEDKS
ncbi:hypothetical protein niasHS_004449 [Heterodera schachtii]|uniref:BTB domain-containing protein n=1 Tax=Heterodera schachtii TaxID=97005 RepID=A0ABD2JR00_HETSC